MSNIIAIIWDFDKTLISGYMEQPIFDDYGVNADDFWRETNSLPEKYLLKQKVKVNPDTIYLNQIIRYVKDGRFKGLSNERLRSYGAKLKYYSGVPEIFEKANDVITNNP